MAEKPLVNRGGRPRKHVPIPGGPDLPRVTVVLTPRQTSGLDRMCIDLRERLGARIDRSAIIRALVDGLLLSGADLTPLVGPGTGTEPEGDVVHERPATYVAGRTERAVLAEQAISAWVRDRLSSKK